nr:hypothetical transcript [Hymenolepis microstoma]
MRARFPIRQLKGRGTGQLRTHWLRPKPTLTSLNISTTPSFCLRGYSGASVIRSIWRNVRLLIGEMMDYTKTTYEIDDPKTNHRYYRAFITKGRKLVIVHV